MDEIKDLYLSGIASAKAGNHRLAQAFFKKVVGINPRHEGAWLWLSEVLDDADDIAYCLETVLAINPHNEKARLGLEVVRRDGRDPARPARPKEWSPLAELRDMDLPTILAQTPSPTPPEPVPVFTPAPKDQGEALRRAAVFAGIVLLVLALAIAAPLALRQPAAPAVESTRVPPTADLSALRAQEREAVESYLRDFDQILGPLRLAHDIFNQQSSVRVSLAEQVDHVSRLKTQVQVARERLQQLTPPGVVAAAHQGYVDGLALEEEALDNLLRYIETSQVGYSNRSTVKSQESSARIEQSKAVFAAYRDWVGVPEPTRLPTPTPLRTPTYGRPPTITPTLPPFPTHTPTPFPTKGIG